MFYIIDKSWFHIPNKTQKKLVLSIISFVIIVTVGLWELNVFEEILLYPLIILGSVMVFLRRGFLWGDWEHNYYSNVIVYLHYFLFLYLAIAHSLSEQNTFYLSLNYDENIMLLCFTIFAITSFSITGIISLRKSPVEPLTTQIPQRTDSIQSETSQFVDVHGHSAQIVSSIKRSDAGVFGVTGVRGAGKSALTRHVLSQLQDHYFVLELTAPVRHDTDMGFFISVCRSVCYKVLDDLAVILQGKKAGYFSRQWKNLRNIVVGLLLIIVAVPPAYLWFFSQYGEDYKWSEYINQFSSNNFNKLKDYPTDPILINNEDGLFSDLAKKGEDNLVLHLILRHERASMDSLLSQIDTILVDSTESYKRLNKSGHYLLLPGEGEWPFLLAVSHPPKDTKTKLSSFEIKSPECFIVNRIHEFFCESDECIYPDPVLPREWCQFHYPMNTYNDEELKTNTQEFQKKSKFNKEKCTVLMLQSQNKPYKMTISGFDDQGQFKSVLMDLPTDRTFRQIRQNNKFITSSLSKLDRSLPINDRFQYKYYNRWVPYITKEPTESECINTTLRKGEKKLFINYTKTYYSQDIKQIFESYKSLNLYVPLSHIIREISFQLLTQNNDDNSVEPILVSHLILQALERGDLRLSFTWSRLEKFRELVEIYRGLLDGHLYTRPLPHTIQTDVDKKKRAFLSILPNIAYDSNLYYFMGIPLALSLFMLFGGGIWRSSVSLVRTVFNRHYLDLYDEADQFLEQLTYSSNQETSRSFSFKVLI